MSKDPSWANRTKSRTEEEIAQQDNTANDTTPDRLEEMSNHYFSWLAVRNNKRRAYSDKVIIAFSE